MLRDVGNVSRTKIWHQRSQSERSKGRKMLWTFFLYLAILLGIGVVANRFTKGLDSFVLGDRQSGVWVTALSYEATAYSGWLMLGFPGKAFTKGLCAIWVGVSCVIGDAL